MEGSRQAAPDVRIDVTNIPQYHREALAVATLELYRSILKSPGGSELLERKKEELRHSRKKPPAGSGTAKSK